LYQRQHNDDSRHDGDATISVDGHTPEIDEQFVGHAQLSIERNREPSWDDQFVLLT
jgi:hypothetical protein